VDLYCADNKVDLYCADNKVDLYCADNKVDLYCERQQSGPTFIVQTTKWTYIVKGNTVDLYCAGSAGPSTLFEGSRLYIEILTAALY
jgi:hypothetical protein